MACLSEVGHSLRVENRALLGFYVASSGNFVPTFRDNLSVLFERSKPTGPKFRGQKFLTPELLTPEDESYKLSETSVRNYHYSLRNDHDKSSSRLLRGGSLKFLRILKSQVRGPVKVVVPNTFHILTLIIRRSRTGTVWFYTSTSNKRAVRPKLYTTSLTRDLKSTCSRLTLVRISINL